MLVLVGRTPLWFDEFIVPAAYARFEKHKRSPAIIMKHIISRLGEPLYNFCLRRCRAVLSDTEAHAELGAKMGGVNMSRYTSVPVGADESIFFPKSSEKANPFQIFYYSSGMQPLHGIPVVLDAAVMLQDDPVSFVLVGGKLPMKLAVHDAQKRGAHIRYESWMDIAELANTMRQSQLCLGGPFGGTRQALNVVTGKTYQSLACGVATVIGDGHATGEPFIDKKNCLKVIQGDATALVETIRWAVSHANGLTQMGSAGRELYEKQFSTQALAGRLRPLIEAL